LLEISVELALVRDSDCCVYAANMHGFGGGGLGSNQTVAGLKPFCFASSQDQRLPFKSDRGGIETHIHAIAVHPPNRFKSDRGGIETHDIEIHPRHLRTVQIRPWRD